MSKEGTTNEGDAAALALAPAAAAPSSPGQRTAVPPVGRIRCDYGLRRPRPRVVSNGRPQASSSSGSGGEQGQAAAAPAERASPADADDGTTLLTSLSRSLKRDLSITAPTRSALGLQTLAKTMKRNLSITRLGSKESVRTCRSAPAPRSNAAFPTTTAAAPAPQPGTGRASKQNNRGAAWPDLLRQRVAQGGSKDALRAFFGGIDQTAGAGRGNATFATTAPAPGGGPLESLLAPSAPAPGRGGGGAGLAFEGPRGRRAPDAPDPGGGVPPRRDGAGDVAAPGSGRGGRGGAGFAFDRRAPQSATVLSGSLFSGAPRGGARPASFAPLHHKSQSKARPVFPPIRKVVAEDAASDGCSREGTEDRCPETLYRSIVRGMGYPGEPIPSLELEGYFLHHTPEQVAAYDADVSRAVRSDDLDALRSIRDSGRTLQCANKFGESVVHAACRRGSHPVVRFLLEEADVSLRLRDDLGRTPLHDVFWASVPSFDVARAILEREPDLLLLADKRGHTPLSYVRGEEKRRAWCRFLEEHKGLLAPRELARPEVAYKRVVA